MLIICIFLIIILIIIYYTRPCENILESQRYTKTLLKDINYTFNDRLILPPILHLKKLNSINIYINSFPILLVPDIGGNRLYAKWNITNINNDICNTYSRYYSQIWPVPPCFSPFTPFANCWKARFTPNKYFLDRKNIHTSIKYFSSIHDMNILYKFGDGIAFSFYPLIKSLKAYKDKYNLFGASYDFRKIANITILENYFNKVQKLVEQSFKKNNKPIILVGHTLGGILINIFLNYHVNSRWKKKFIKSFIAIHVPFTGTPIAKQAIEIGTNEGIGIQSIAYSTANWYKDIEQYIGGLYLLLEHCNIPEIKKLLFFRNMNPNVKIHFIKCNTDLVDISIPKDWNITTYSINSSHKKIINNINFLKLFQQLIQ